MAEQFRLEAYGPMDGKTVVISGATNGIGFEAARALSRAGARVVIVSRNPEKTPAVAAQIAKETGNSVVPVIADYSDLAQVRSAAARIVEQFPIIDVLANNAGAIYPERISTRDGHELTWQVDYLAHYLMTRELRPALVAADAARVITVSSDAHLGAWRGLDFDDLDHEESWSSFGAYAAAKLADIMFAFELARRWASLGVTSNTMHPGLVHTGFGRSGDWRERGIWRFMGPLSISPAKGADTLVYLASSAEMRGVTGTYFYRRKPKRPSPAARDERSAERLWRLSARELGLPE